MVTLRARDSAVVREVATFSWLGLAHQRRGVGTEARLGLLTLAFDHLDAEAGARTRPAVAVHGLERSLPDLLSNLT